MIHEEEEIVHRITVNQKDHAWDRYVISYEDVIDLAEKWDDHGEVYTVTYQYMVGLKQKVNGTLVPGEATHTKHDMIFNVHLTNNG